MPNLLQFFIIIPLAGFLVSLLVPSVKERILSAIALATVGIQLLGILSFILWWWSNGFPTLDIKQLVLYKSHEYEFFIDFYFDRVTAVFALVGAILTSLVIIFSQFYMHREQGFKRFFNTLLLFFCGYNLVIFSGNFETLFVGWEMLGVTSFLLIAFYRDRYLPVKNGFKVLSYYRLGDICLILAMWMSHHLWHRNITYAELSDGMMVQEYFQRHYWEAIFISILIVIAAMIKSAQMPFSAWLPRAMEGPTTSSAIFYGSLSVHIGVFILLRTYAFWETQWLVKGLIIAVGLGTSVITAGIARVQSSVKTQIAYASVAQIGLMFIEVALGFHILALVHFAGNAFLRTYQLLVSPSVLHYRIHDMFFNFVPRSQPASNPRFQRLRQAFYILSVKEWNVDFLLYRYLWQPFKWVGNQLNFMNLRWSTFAWVLLLVTGIACYFFKESVEPHLYWYLPVFFAGLALLMVLKAFSERGDAKHALLLVFFSQMFMALSIIWNKEIEWQQVAFYLGDSVVAAGIGYACLQRIKNREGNVDLDEYHGHSYEYRGVALLFLLSCLAFADFPISPTFIGVDLMFTHIHKNQLTLVVIWAVHFLFLELALLRIYTRIFLGQHRKTYHPIAFKSS